MATNIHTHIEYKAADGRWLHYAAPCCRGMSYRLMSLIAGVRNDDNGIQPMIAPRGLPADVSLVTAVSYAEDNKNQKSTGETWYGAEEFLKLQERWNETAPSDMSQLDKDFEERVFRTYGPGGSAIASHKGFEDCRVIFWFDD